MVKNVIHLFGHFKMFIDSRCIRKLLIVIDMVFIIVIIYYLNSWVIK